MFMPGHDAKLKGRLLQQARQGSTDALRELQRRHWDKFLLSGTSSVPATWASGDPPNDSAPAGADGSVRRDLKSIITNYELSSYRESLLEQIFCADLLQGCWMGGFPPVEIDRPLVDFQGYDLVLTCQGITRHVQLKATKGRVSVHRALGSKASACVINLLPFVAGNPRRVNFTYLFWGAAPGEPLDLRDLKAARKTINVRGRDGIFAKPERTHHVEVPSSYFETLTGVDALASRLFGVPPEASNPTMTEKD